MTGKNFISIGSFVVDMNEVLYCGINAGDAKTIHFTFKNGHDWHLQFSSPEEATKELDKIKMYLEEC